MGTKPVYKIARVDLSNEKVRIEELDDKIVRKFLGGAGIGAKILWEETNEKTDPFSEQNPLVFAVGPFAGTTVPHGSRYDVSAISPETGIWGDARAGGRWPYSLGRAGLIGVVVTGKANRPVYLWVKDGQVKIANASHLWGMTTYDVEPALRRETDEKASVAAIGPGGERLVRFANIISDGRHAKAAGRCGMGAVMGSKKLKAIVVTGTGKPQIYDEERLRESIERNFPKTHAWPEGKYDPRPDRIGTLFLDRGAVKNFQQGYLEGFAEKLAWDWGRPDAENDFCPQCRTGCGASRMLNGTRTNHGELTIPMGSNCLIDDFEALQKAQDLCNENGIDDITAGDLIAFSMECYEKGLITQTDTEGIDLRWGSVEACLQLLQKIIKREGFGEVLGEGILSAVKKIGGRAAEYAVHVKGLPTAAHDPRSANAYALQNATGSRGGCHSDGYPFLYRYFLKEKLGEYMKQEDLYSFLSEKGKRAGEDRFAVEGMGEFVARGQDLGMVLNSLLLCWFSPYSVGWLREPDTPYTGTEPRHWAEWLHWIAGWEDIDAKEIQQIGERIFNLQRLINVRRGISRKDDFLPPRLMTHKRGGLGGGAVHIPPLGALLNEYYLVRGWSEEGIPTKEKLAELEIPSLIRLFE